MSAGNPSHRTLETLPNEVRFLILSFVDLPTLDNLVHASPVFHAQYLGHRRYFLCTALDLTLGDYVAEACISLRSRIPSGGLSGISYHAIGQMLLTLNERKPSFSGYPILNLGLTEDEAVQMAAFHLGKVQPLAVRFTEWAMSKPDCFPALAGLRGEEWTRALVGDGEVFGCLYWHLMISSNPAFQLRRMEAWYSSRQQVTEGREVFSRVIAPWKTQLFSRVGYFLLEELSHRLNQEGSYPGSKMRRFMF
ncbi:hypothetical protein VTK73DRAFT_4998 [Phialemonium thermophilum]|uniref:F-box domain-containing protein n=1 Tax=Phialemonium thermophilum TaxID=223376 RepID=A0ABR3WQK0_9PEZI